MRRRQVLGLGAAGLMQAAAPALPDPALHDRDPDQYWARIRREQFLLPDWRIYLNNGSLGVAPKPVVDAVSESIRNGASLVKEEYPRWGYETLDSERAEVAEFLGCAKDELAFMHNATEAMSTIADGLDLRAGDEVLITDQEHPSGRFPWLRKQARYDISVREVKIELPPKSSGELVDKLVSAIGPKTRVLSFSGILTTTGLIMPMRAICDAARAKGVITVVDGAHMTGQIGTKVRDIGCDFWAGSPHKWLFAPPGCGLMYVRESMLDRLWPSTVTGNWDNKQLKAARFMQIGTNNRAVIDGMIAGLRFHKALGTERVLSRIHSLARSVYERAKHTRAVELLSPEDDRMYGALVTFRIKSPDLAPFWAAGKKKRMWVYQADRLRVSTHVHTRPSDIGTLFETIEEVYEKKGV